MRSDLDELERIAKAATNGPWIAGDDEDSDYYLIGPHEDGLVSNAVVKTHDVNNAEFIASFNPLVAQELINRLREAEKDAERYQYLRERDLETIENGGVFAGITPYNFVLNGIDLDQAIDDAIAQE